MKIAIWMASSVESDIRKIQGVFDTLIHRTIDRDYDRDNHFENLANVTCSVCLGIR